jgi:Icc-related predicted phosphoesterase
MVAMKKIIVMADTHGKWDSMYKKEADIILHCGDIETLVNEEDLRYFPAPSKFKENYVFEFEKYYTKGSVPIPTYFIAGNHENWGMLSQYTQGPVKIIENLYYFGNYGITEIDGLVVAGFSKIYHPIHSYGYRWKKNRGKVKHASYFNILDMLALIELSENYKCIDILLLHENPFYSGEGKTYGSEEITKLIEALSPKYVFCGHMHFQGKRKIGDSIVINIEKNGVSDELLYI